MEPDWVLGRLADPRRGIVSRLSFLPTVAELLRFCEEVRIEDAEERDRNARAALPPPEPLPTYTPEEIERRKAFTARVRKMAQSPRPDNEPAPMTFDEWTVEARKAFAKPVKLSDEALSLVGVSQRQQ
jgi:hypothetical protein